MGYSILHEKTSHQSLSTGIIVSDVTRRLRYMGSSGSFKGDSGGSCWNENGQLIGMQVEVQKVPHTQDEKGRPASPASGGRCCIVAMISILHHIQVILTDNSCKQFSDFRICCHRPTLMGNMNGMNEFSSFSGKYFVD